jgi:hypothetical protein
MPKEEQQLSITVLEYKPYVKGTMLAFVKLQVDNFGIVIDGCTHHRKNDSQWVGTPAKKFPKKDGGEGWVAVVDFATDQDRYDFRGAAVAAIRAYLEGGRR